MTISTTAFPLSHPAFRYDKRMFAANQLSLTWDLLIIVFVAIVIAYSFIVGKEEAIKIIIVTYLAGITIQATGMLLSTLMSGTEHIILFLGLPVDLPILAGTRLLLLTALIIFFSVRGGIDTEFGAEPSNGIAVLITGLLGFATAGLLLTIIITYIANAPLLDSGLSTYSTIIPLIKQSRLIAVIIEYQALWVALPALLLVGISLLYQEDE